MLSKPGEPYYVDVAKIPPERTFYCDKIEVRERVDNREEMDLSEDDGPTDGAGGSAGGDGGSTDGDGGAAISPAVIVLDDGRF